MEKKIHDFIWMWGMWLPMAVVCISILVSHYILQGIAHHTKRMREALLED